MMRSTTAEPELAARDQGLVGSVIDSSTSLLQRQTNDLVRFAMGSPAAESVPTKHFAEICAAELGQDCVDSFARTTTEGDRRQQTAALDMHAGTGEATAPERTAVGVARLRTTFDRVVAVSR